MERENCQISAATFRSALTGLLPRYTSERNYCLLHVDILHTLVLYSTVYYWSYTARLNKELVGLTRLKFTVKFDFELVKPIHYIARASYIIFIVL
jgi:hypothetical protein